jgi:lipopolysaccharide export system permease protein
MSFGNLGEHYEITALKSAGISLPRLLIPVAIYAAGITILALLFNNYVVPVANLKAFSLMYDVRQKKPTMELKEGGFYNGLQNYSIRIERKDKDGGVGLYGLMIYDHSGNRGNVDVILSDSGTMQTINEDSYLVIDLKHGFRFSEKSNVSQNKQEFVRDEFSKAKFVIDMTNLGLQETPEELFKHNKVMKDIPTLLVETDSLEKDAKHIATQSSEMLRPYHDFQFSEERKQISHQKYDSIIKKANLPKDYLQYKDIVSPADMAAVYDRAFSKVRNLQSFAIGNYERVESTLKQAREFKYEMWTRFTLAVSCFMMFLIGAPLGTIIKKGGLGVPTLISVVFFLLYYAISLTCMRYAHEGLLDVTVAAWVSNVVLFIFGCIFLWQARNDSRLFDFDAYLVIFERWREKWKFSKK